ncbi:hypothetical protein Q7P37_003589 [Cladosporium fusiforme]
MAIRNDIPPNKLSHYKAWTEAWLSVQPLKLPPAECYQYIIKEGTKWLHEDLAGTVELAERAQTIVACFKTAAKARLIILGGKVPPSCDEYDVLSESYDARVKCDCPGLFPVPASFDASGLSSCGCKAVERMVTEGDHVNSKSREWNSSVLFSAKGLSSAMVELALCHSDIHPSPSSCRGKQGEPDWPEVQAPDRKPSAENDLDEQIYSSLYPTHERIRLSADAKHFFAVASGFTLVDPGVQMAIADSGNDILIGDYCDAATEDCLSSLQSIGASAFAFLKLCVYAEFMTEWQFNQLVAQVIQFRIISYWRDHALPHRPQGVYGSRMSGLGVHRHIDLGMAVGIVSASTATGETITAGEYTDIVHTSTLINDLLDFRGDTWRNQRENVVLRGVRGCLCEYLDGLLVECIRGAASLAGRGKIFAFLIMCFCNWMLMSSGHKVYEILHGTRPITTNPPCLYKSQENGAYEELLQALEPYGTLGTDGPHVDMKRKELQVRYAKHRLLHEEHTSWAADAVRIILHPDNLRRLVDVVHYQWTGELGNVNYCA